MFVNSVGGLTTAGYVLFIALAVISLIAASVIAGKVSKKGKMSAKQLTFCSMAIALAYVTSYIKLFSLPFSGSVTLCSMLFIVLVGYWYGPATGLLVGFVYGILQFIQKPYWLTLFQVCADYLLAFSALGLSGFFSGKKHGLTIGYLVGVFGRGVSTRWQATCTGWSICRKLFRNHWRLFTRSFIISDSCWQKP